MIINFPATYVNNYQSSIKEDVQAILADSFGTSSLQELQSLIQPVADKYNINIYVADLNSAYTGTIVQGFTDQNSVSLEILDIGQILYTTGNKYVYTMKDMTEPGQEIRVRDVLISQMPIIFCIILGLSIASSFLVACIVTRPIRKLSETSILLAKSEQTKIPYMHRKDEIGQLSTNLSCMYDGLQHSLENEQHQRILRDKLFQSVSHELKTPITILQGELEGMLYNMGDYKDRDTYIAHSLEVVQDMAKMVHKILDISKGTSSYEIKDCNLSQLVFTQCQRYITLANQKNIDFVYDTGNDITTPADTEALGRAISNLLSNAINYSPEGATVLVHVEEHFLYIENSGVNLPENCIEDLFEPFVRLEDSHNRDYGGSGLGLYFVKSILEAHQKSYEMKNTDTGVRFTIQY